MHDDSFARETIVKGVIDFPIDFSVGESLVSRYLHRETNKVYDFMCFVSLRSVE